MEKSAEHLDTEVAATAAQFTELAEKQRTLGEEIKRQLSNMKKDGQSRKDQPYIQKHEATFNNLWGNFEQRHGILSSLNQPAQKYFTQNFHGQVKALHDTAMELLRQYQEQLNEKQESSGRQPFTSEDPNTRHDREFILEQHEYKVSTEDQKLRIKKQNTRIEMCRRIINDVASSKEKQSVSYYEFKIQELSNLWFNILQLHEEIMAFATSEDLGHPYFDGREFENLEPIYQKIMIELHEFKKEKSLLHREYTQDGCDVKLPRINIPNFDGNYKMWTAFHDIYVRIIHSNKHIGNAEKMNYLKTSLKGEAYKLIQHLTSSDVNYQAAWELIINRFNNKRILFSSHLETLLSQPSGTNESVSALKQLHDTTKECMHALSNLNVDTSSWSPLIAHIIIKKLDKETHKLYEQSLKEPREIPQLEDVLNFLETRFQSLEVIGEPKRRTEYIPLSKGNTPLKKNWSLKNYHVKVTKCRYCNGDHNIYTCQKFRALTIFERKNFVTQSKTCMNCLNHGINEKCYSQRSCVSCKQQHHSLLHPESNSTAARQHITTKPITSHISVASDEVLRHQTTTHIAKSTSNALLATALIRVRTIRNTYDYVRALIDPGSQATFITEDAAQSIGNPRTKIYTEISGMGGSDAGISNSKIELELFPRFPSSFKLRCEALVLSSLTKPQPDDEINTKDVSDWINVILADPTYDTPGPIDLIIGADIFGDILLDGIKKTTGGLLAQRTQFGWILSGRAELSRSTSRKIVSMISRVDIDKQLRQFWEIEETTSDPVISEDDSKCEEIFNQTTRRNRDGTYTVNIPFKEGEQQLGESRCRALARLYQMERKFSKDKALHEEYCKFMQEYLHLGHMRPIGIDEHHCTTNSYYMPHQAVIKEDSSTTKLRVVFDASTKTSTGISLNDRMYNGPRLQQNLQQILLRWRKHQWVFTADIEKMYRQIKVTEEHQNYQRILWRFSTNDRIQEFKLTTVTYGTKSAPYLAVRTLQELARDEAHHHPEAAETILKDFYVDDLMSGTYSLQKAKVLQRELIRVLKSGGFNLRKWKSNHKALLDNLSEDLREQSEIEINEGEAVKTLGVYWNPTKDEFRFKVKLEPTSKALTKRLVLSDIAKLFDPLGWLSPVIVRAKILLQELWTKGYSWDQPLEEDFSKKWIKFRSEIHQVETISIPRWIHYNPDNNTLELHGFCDASEKAYGAVVYSKITTEYGKTFITLITSKTKVAPLKKITLPRLELCSAVLLTKLIQQTKQALELEDAKVYAWTDSMITLAWINGRADRWKTFVSHRVADIQQNIGSSHWKHVRSDDNPADLASRGVDPHILKDNALWWTGPSWLKLTESNWPKTNSDINNIQKLEEKSLLSTNIVPQPNNEEILSRFSTLRKLIRVLAYCNRFISRCRKQTPKENTTEPTVKEIQLSLKQVIKMMQSEEFATEIRQLKKKLEVSKKSSILSLNPFIDENGILRVGGRIENSNVPYDEKHPIIIPHKHFVTGLLIQEAHLATLHGGNEATLAFIKRRYWIINGRSKVRQELHKCVKCCRFKGQSMTQIMGMLPSPRVTPSSPFTHTGVDYAGPIQIKTSKLRNSKCHKGYIVIFVCLATKAIHIEAVTDMTSEAFLAAFKRFTARRGLPSCIYSDNGTNFVGATKLLDKDLQQAISQANAMGQHFATEGVKWNFIPPAAPHFGGIWEAGVKSIKYHLKRIVGDTILTFEELTTLLYQIEACLNSRPLYPLTSDPSSELVLTPGHFLVGRALVRPPEPNTADNDILPLTRWKRVQKMAQDFWKIWQKEYLSRLQQRHKWQSGNHNIEVGRIVLIKDETCSPAKWPLARVVETHPGKDGVVRVVTLRHNGNSLIKRPITKLCLLPIENKELEEEGEEESNEDQRIQSSTHIIMANTSTTNQKDDTLNRQIAKTPAKDNIKDKKTTIRHPLKGRFLPINPNWTEHISNLKRKNKEPSQSPGTTSTKMAKLLLTTMLVLGVVQSGNTQYTIKRPQPGLYIEHIGKAMLKRGTLRVELNVPLNTTAEKDRVNGIVTKMTNACNHSKKFSADTHCNTLLEHLHDRRNAIMNEIDILNNKEERKRSKRGILGKLLQSVFGVNDEVYTDIETLEQNQQVLRQATNHQANILLSIMTRMNDTEGQLTRKVNLITDKLNKVITEVNKVEGWYEKIDGNKVSIHILAAYQISIDVLENIEKRYIKLLEANLGRSSLLDFITPSKLNDIINKAAKKMPLNLRIISEPVPKLELSVNKTNVRIYGFLQIVEIDEYELIKVTPIPKRVRNNTYIATDISSSLLGTNFNAQKYFELTEDEFRNCVNVEGHLRLCTPTVVSNMETNTNCVIDEIYHRQDRKSCPIKEFNTPKVMWKHLFMVNTWLFIADSSTSAAIKCKGNREDITLSGVGILQINQECLIQTRKNTLYSEINNKALIKSTFMKPIDFNITRKMDSKTSQIEALDVEPILKTSDHFFSMTKDQEDLENIISARWKKIGYHATTATSSICITLAIVFVIWKYHKCQLWTPKLKQGNTEAPMTAKNDISLPIRDTQDQTKDFSIHPCEEIPKQFSQPIPVSRLHNLSTALYARPAECLHNKHN